MNKMTGIEFGICKHTEDQIICLYQSDSIIDVLRQFAKSNYDNKHFITVYELIDYGNGIETYAIADLKLDYNYMALPGKEESKA